MRERAWRGVREDPQDKHDFFVSALVQGSHSQARSGSEERVSGLWGGGEARLTYVGETVGLAEKLWDDRHEMGQGDGKEEKRQTESRFRCYRYLWYSSA